MNLSVKNSTLLFISLVFILFSGVFLTIIYTQSQNRMSIIEKEEYDNIKSMYQKMMQKQISFYTNRINANINSAGVKEAIATKNKEQLLEISLGRFDTLKSENPNFISMNFYSKDGGLLLNMKNPELHEENELSKYKLLNKLHENQKSVNGYEFYKNLFAFRIIQAIYHEDIYIGAIEFSLQPQFIINQMDEYYDVEGALLVDTEMALDKNNNYILLYNILNSSAHLDKILNKKDFFASTKLEMNENEIYSLYSFNVEDLESNNLGKIIFVKNMTQKVLESQKEMKNIIMLLFSALIATLVFVNIGFNRNIRNLENSYEDVSKYKALIDENLITLSTDLNGEINEVSDAFCSLSKFNKNELMGMQIQLLLHDDMTKDEYKKIINILQEKQCWSGEIKEQKQDGHFFWVYANIQPKYKNNSVIGYDTVMHDITQKKINEELMITDGLTHIYNRRYFNDTLPRMIKSIRRDGGNLCLSVFDIDFFKQYNDTYGHIQGDNALIEVAAAIKNTLNRPQDFCFRLGGEEFALLFKCTSQEDAKQLVEKVRMNIIQLEIKHEKNEPYKILTASFGVVVIQSDTLLSWEEIYSMADTKMYLAKNSGRNTIKL